MKKLFVLIFVLGGVFGLTGIANAKTKSLCMFPFGPDGVFEVMFDQRNYDSDYFTTCYPNGGIFFNLWLGNFSTSKSRDKMVKNVKKVIFKNSSNGYTYIVKKPSKYKYGDFFCADYSITIGRDFMAIGKWTLQATYKNNTYKGSFQITQEMIDQTAPIPVKPQVLEPVGDTFEIVAPITNGDQYLLRILDESGIVTNDNMIIDGDYVRYTYPVIYMDKMARIETRIYNADWPILMLWGQPDTCDSTGMNIGHSTSRSIIYFKTNVIE